MSHYYTNDQVKSEPHSFTFEFGHHKIVFHTDRGVFSYQFIDYGTRVLLNALNIEGVNSVLDVGCGYGAIGVTLSVLYPELSIDMVDVNLRALDLARRNISENHGHASIYESNVYSQVNQSFDMIVSNPPIRAGKDVVHAIIEQCIDYLNENGKLVIVLQKKQGAPSAKKKMIDVFGNVEIIKKDKGYYILESIYDTAKK